MPAICRLSRAGTLALARALCCSLLFDFGPRFFRRCRRCESGGTGRRTGLRIQRATMGVRIPPLAPTRSECSRSMKIDIDSLSSTQRKIRVELPGDTVDKEFVRAYENLGRQAKIKGFRPGKVPRSVLQGIYGDEVKGQVLSRLVERSLGEAIKERGLKVISEPEVDAEPLEEGRAFAFSALVEVKPDVEAKDYLGVELKKVKLSVTDEQVDGALERLRDAHAQLVPVEDRDIVERGDFVTIDFSGTIEGQPMPGGKTENYSVEVGGGGVLPEFESGRSEEHTSELQSSFG